MLVRPTPHTLDKSIRVLWTASVVLPTPPFWLTKADHEHGGGVNQQPHFGLVFYQPSEA